MPVVPATAVALRRVGWPIAASWRRLRRCGCSRDDGNVAAAGSGESGGEASEVACDDNNPRASSCGVIASGMTLCGLAGTRSRTAAEEVDTRGCRIQSSSNITVVMRPSNARKAAAHLVRSGGACASRQLVGAAGAHQCTLWPSSSPAELARRRDAQPRLRHCRRGGWPPDAICKSRTYYPFPQLRYSPCSDSTTFIDN